MFKMFLKALETEWKDWTKAVARSHDTPPLNSSFGSYCCLCWEQLVVSEAPPKLRADKFECQNKTTQRSKLQASNYFSSNTRLINKMGRRRYRVSKCRHKLGAVRGWRQMRSDVPPSQRVSLASTTVAFLSNWLTSMAGEFVSALCA